jgi:hypothetical protein
MLILFLGCYLDVGNVTEVHTTSIFRVDKKHADERDEKEPKSVNIIQI